MSGLGQSEVTSEDKKRKGPEEKKDSERPTLETVNRPGPGGRVLSPVQHAAFCRPTSPFTRGSARPTQRA
ncbi:hypothetical protein EYF80_029659 [Liparis tanakae]|uniref:Uncharacterized protein n=1 Tax=Liparis tanakae TaxID=230148 RepID=A0A4Z2H2J2_9TELE|nr:hypothetical protein EYF80_029659 [Liparis tanakae]